MQESRVLVFPKESSQHPARLLGSATPGARAALQPRCLVAPLPQKTGLGTRRSLGCPGPVWPCWWWAVCTGGGVRGGLALLSPAGVQAAGCRQAARLS